MTKLTALSALLLSVWAAGCSKSKTDVAAYDTAMNADIQLANRDTAAQPPPTDSRNDRVAYSRRTFPPPPSSIGADSDTSRPATYSAPTILVERDTIGVRSSPLPDSLTRADSVAIEKQLKNLRSASIEFHAPDTLLISKPEQVEIIIDPKVATQAKSGSTRIRPTATHVSSRTEVCLSASGFKVEDEGGAENHCRTQIVPFTAPSYWHWTVTALPEIKTSGIRPMDVTVNALLDSFPKYTVYTTHHTAYVRVDDPGKLARLQSLLNTWQALLLAIATILGVLAKGMSWLKSRRAKAKAEGS